jgi:hypothetical protein
MPHQHHLLLVVSSLLLAMAMATERAASVACSVDLSRLLASQHCMSRHGLPSVTTDPCRLRIRKLLAKTQTKQPCTTAIGRIGADGIHDASDGRSLRRLEASGYSYRYPTNYATTFSCSFVSPPPAFNETNWSDKFEISCTPVYTSSSSSSSSWSWLLWLLAATCGLLLIILCCYKCRGRLDERQRQELIEAGAAPRRVNVGGTSLLDDRQRQELIEAGAAPRRVNAGAVPYTMTASAGS